MDQIYRTHTMQSNDWKLPLNVAIGIHLLVILGALYLPGLFKAKPRFADVYTVSVINIAEPNNSAHAPAKAQRATPRPSAKVQKTTPPRPVKTQEAAPPVPVTPPVKTQKVAPIAETPKPIEQASPKAISLKPLKKKIVQDNKELEELARKQTLERKQELERKQDLARKQELDRKQRQQRQKLAQALREEELLAEKAKLAQEELAAERKLLQASEQIDSTLPVTSSATSSTASGDQTSTASSADSGSSNLLESQYLASVFNRLHQFWTPPEYLQQDPNLTAVVVITVNLDGTVANMQFESKSGNKIFDQFVSKTIEDAAPLPPIPPALKKQRFEIGLRFKPGSIQ